MELRTDGDGHQSNDVTTLPDNNLTPFPVSANAVYSHPTSVVPPPPEIDHLPVSPARKLCPVRCGNGRRYINMVDSSCDMDETLMNCSSDLGGVFSQFSAQNANTIIPGECGFEFSAVQQMKSVFDADCFNLISQARTLEAELSSSSDDNESSKAIEERLNRKRKRETWKSLKLYLEDMVKRLMGKQEQMHKQLIEMIEKKEQERIIREEGWKQQEIERAKRDEEFRAEETSRNLALISSSRIYWVRSSRFQNHQKCQAKLKMKVKFMGKKLMSNLPCNRRWPKSEVQDLVPIRIALDNKFLKGAKGSVWEEVADGLAKKGYIRTPKKCKEKWENINKYYKRTVDSAKACLRNYRSCPYFRELDILYKSHLLTQGTRDCVKSETASKKVEE